MLYPTGNATLRGNFIPAPSQKVGVVAKYKQLRKENKQAAINMKCNTSKRALWLLLTAPQMENGRCRDELVENDDAPRLFLHRGGSKSTR
jgi:predicted component of type VI protein secretion system